MSTEPTRTDETPQSDLVGDGSSGPFYQLPPLPDSAYGPDAVPLETIPGERLGYYQGRFRVAADVAFKGPDDTDVGMLLTCAANLDAGYEVGGSNVRAAVARVLRVAADLLREAS